MIFEFKIDVARPWVKIPFIPLISFKQGFTFGFYFLFFYWYIGVYKLP